MNESGTVVATAIGLACAAIGIAARPKASNAENKVRTLLTAGAAAVPVLAWVFWFGHPLATPLGFVAGTVVAGQFRDSRHELASRRTGAAHEVETETATGVETEDKTETETAAEIEIAGTSTPRGSELAARA
jgi:hypothetical protein